MCQYYGTPSSESSLSERTSSGSPSSSGVIENGTNAVINAGSGDDDSDESSDLKAIREMQGTLENNNRQARVYVASGIVKQEKSMCAGSAAIHALVDEAEKSLNLLKAQTETEKM